MYFLFWLLSLAQIASEPTVYDEYEATAEKVAHMDSVPDGGTALFAGGSVGWSSDPLVWGKGYNFPGNAGGGGAIGWESGAAESHYAIVRFTADVQDETGKAWRSLAANVRRNASNQLEGWALGVEGPTSAQPGELTFFTFYDGVYSRTLLNYQVVDGQPHQVCIVFSDENAEPAVMVIADQQLGLGIPGWSIVDQHITSDDLRATTLGGDGDSPLASFKGTIEDVLVSKQPMGADTAELLATLAAVNEGPSHFQSVGTGGCQIPFPAWAYYQRGLSWLRGIPFRCGFRMANYHPEERKR